MLKHTPFRKQNQAIHLPVLYNDNIQSKVDATMYEWHKNIQKIVDEIDLCIKAQTNEALTLQYLAHKFGYSAFYISRKFKEISGMQFRDYLRYRKLAFALKQVRDTQYNMLDIALNYGFSSHEAFTRAFK